MFVQLNVLCLGNWLHAPLCKKCGEVLVFSIFHPTRLFRPTQLLIWMNFPPYTIIPHCIAIRAISQRNGLYICTHRLCSNRIQIIFCKYVEISVDNIINLFVLQILINLFLYFNFSDRNGLYAKQTSLFVIITQHSNSHVHEDLKFKFFSLSRLFQVL